MQPVPERLVAWVLRSISGAVVFAGVAVFVAAIPAFGMLTESSVPPAIGVMLLQTGGALVAAGITAKLLLRRGAVTSSSPLTTDHGHQPLSVLHFLCCATLVAAPLWLLVRLRPFLNEWREVIDLLSAGELWDSANANMSGVVLIPLFAALTPPFIELVTLSAFIGTSVLVVPLLLARSSRAPMYYLAAAVLLAALVVASWRGASAATLAGDALMGEAVRFSANAEELATVTRILDRYGNAVAAALPPLVWALFAYLIWLPLLTGPRGTASAVQT